MTKQIEDYPELDKWCNDNFIHESDSTLFECYEAEAVEQKLLEMQSKIDSQQERIIELEGGFDPISELILDCFGKRPVPCDGMLYVPSHKYNKLARKLNELNKESK